ncbi:MAG: phytanoyl-CoA dioxygenase family protein [Pseudomonadota bacterium]
MNQAVFISETDIALGEFRNVVSQELTQTDLRFADRVEKNVPIYDAAALGDILSSPLERKALLSEWVWVLGHSAGVLALSGAYQDTAIIDRVSGIFLEIIAAEKSQSGGGADHFAKAGANDRIWNSLQKLCLADPNAFIRYFANAPISAVCEAWLGPAYQMTAQVNLVRPGGAAQEAHRDYHLGFQTNTVAGTYPAHVHDLSPVLTLQGGIAHCDMPLDSGPTKLLPFSQLYREGYLAYRDPDFRAYFEDNFVQIELKKGDAIFFNPALFHAAGRNQSADIERLVNLLQVSSAFGRAMERVDRMALCKAAFPALKGAAHDFSDAECQAAIWATAEGYSFPTNLDTDPPVGGLAPKTQATLMAEALKDNSTLEDFSAALDALDARQRP